MILVSSIFLMETRCSESKSSCHLQCSGNQTRIVKTGSYIATRELLMSLVQLMRCQKKQLYVFSEKNKTLECCFMIFIVYARRHTVWLGHKRESIVDPQYTIYLMRVVYKENPGLDIAMNRKEQNTIYWNTKLDHTCRRQASIDVILFWIL